MKTFLELLNRGAELYPERDAFRIRTKTNYTAVSYLQFRNDVMNLAAQLEVLGLSGAHLAVIGENSYQWVVVYFATVVSGGVIIPIDKELTGDQVGDLLVEGQVMALFCSHDYIEVADALKQDVSRGLADIKYFAINCPPSSSSSSLESAEYVNLETLFAGGATILSQAISGEPNIGRSENRLSDDDFTARAATIVFTSGTTGVSKGVMLSRANLFANVESADQFIKLGDTTLAVLPMHHTYAFTLDILFGLYQGRTIAINNGIKYFAQNMKLFAPTDMLVVPLVAESLYNTVWQTVRNSGKESALRKLIKVSNGLRCVGIDLRGLFFKAIHTAFGGRLKALFVGGAYLDPQIAQGFDDLGVEINIGYGITECSPLVAGNITHRKRYTGSCGVAIPGVEIRVDQSGSKVASNAAGEGEILVRGANIMIGYYNNIEATEAVLSADGWFRTGDIGRLDSRGMLFITGRIKNLIVLKNGKNVYPEELEGLISKVDLVKEVVVSASENSAGEELMVIAEIFIDADQTEARYGLLDTAHHDAQVEVQTQIQGINDSLPYYKRIVSVKFRETEFPKTTTKKIKRY